MRPCRIFPLRYSALLIFAVLCSSRLFSLLLRSFPFFSLRFSAALASLRFSSKNPLIVEQRTKSAPRGTGVACITPYSTNINDTTWFRETKLIYVLKSFYSQCSANQVEQYQYSQSVSVCPIRDAVVQEYYGYNMIWYNILLFFCSYLLFICKGCSSERHSPGSIGTTTAPFPIGSWPVLSPMSKADFAKKFKTGCGHGNLDPFALLLELTKLAVTLLVFYKFRHRNLHLQSEYPRSWCQFRCVDRLKKMQHSGRHTAA